MASTGNFKTPLRAEKIGQREGRALWKLTAPLVYWSPSLAREITVPEGFKTDFASVPRLPLAYLLAGDTAHEAAVVHDYLYQMNGCTRAEADEVLDEASLAAGEPAWRRKIMWAAVRVAGGVMWDKYRRREK